MWTAAAPVARRRAQGGIVPTSQRKALKNLDKLTMPRDN